jgi:DNA ligase (NAD+)
MIKEFLEKASKAYYEGNPIITDDEFDRLVEASGYDAVGHITNGVPHLYRMYSLDKVHFNEKEPEFKDPYTTVKLDGAAVSLLYIPTECGKMAYARGLTRGDGIRGIDITEKIRHLVPQFLDTKKPPFQINAEIVAPKSIPNARNYASGSLGLKDATQIQARDLALIAHDLLQTDTLLYSGTLRNLNRLGFKTPVFDDISIYPTDGYVIRENNNELFVSAGFTSKFPRAAYALKPKPQVVVTRLLGVEWNVGRTGTVNPVAILEPVLLGDATVSRATLHNMEHISALNLEIGCFVEVVRSGEIIPRIIGRLNEL